MRVSSLAREFHFARAATGVALALRNSRQANNMHSLGQRLILALAVTIGFGACAVALTTAVQYKPWGVPDDRRAEYDAIIAKIDRRAELKEQLAGKPVAAAFAPRTTLDAGLWNPNATASHSFEIQNRGERPLELEIKTTHGCEASLASTTVPPAESTSITLRVDTAEPDQRLECNATVLTSDPLSSQLTFTVNGQVKSDLVIPESVEFTACDPMQDAEGSFIIYSQNWDDLNVEDVTCELEKFNWHAEPLDADDPEFVESSAASAWRIRIWNVPAEYGKYAGTITLNLNRTGAVETAVRALTCFGRVRAPIVFHSPDIHVARGLNIGTLVTGKEHAFHLLVRTRGQLDRKLEVLNVRPTELEASLSPLSSPDNYRLTLTVPADCSMVVFNSDEKHGYVEVGDPDDDRFSGWFPVYGAVIQLDE